MLLEKLPMPKARRRESSIEVLPELLDPIITFRPELNSKLISPIHLKFLICNFFKYIVDISLFFCRKYILRLLPSLI